MDYQYLAHYGVKNQKWGIRKYQNNDGSLTPMGRIHYGIGKAREKLSDTTWLTPADPRVKRAVGNIKTRARWATEDAKIGISRLKYKTSQYSAKKAQEFIRQNVATDASFKKLMAQSRQIRINNKAKGWVAEQLSKPKLLPAVSLQEYDRLRRKDQAEYESMLREENAGDRTLEREIASSRRSNQNSYAYGNRLTPYSNLGYAFNRGTLKSIGGRSASPGPEKRWESENPDYEEWLKKMMGK